MESKRVFVLLPSFPTITFAMVIVTFICVSAPFCQAHAATAWVLWEHTEMLGGRYPIKEMKVLHDDWKLGETFPDYQSCMNTIYIKVKAVSSYFLRDCKAEEGISHCSFSENNTSFLCSCRYPSDLLNHLNTDFYCYPDTIDPRKK